MSTFLTTESDKIITTESGLDLVIDGQNSNEDIQSFDFSVDLLRALLWEYNDAVNLQALLQNKQDWYNDNQASFWNNWIRDVFDMRTANEFGLRVWSIILALPLFVNTPPDPLDKPTWGFGPYRRNFNRGNFSSRTGSSVNLSLESKRLALRLRYFQLTTTGAVPEVNRFLAYIFAPYGHVYLLDRYNMTQRYIFTFPIPAEMQYLFNNFDILPRPAGVGSSYYDITKKYWGFGPNHLNFERGTFNPAA